MLRSDPRPSRRPARPGRHQGKAPAPGNRHGGRDIATVNLEFKVHGHDLIDASQTWLRFPMPAGKVIAAHVSTMNDKPLW